MTDQSSLGGSGTAGILLYWRVISRQRKFLGIFVAAAVVLTMITSLFLTNIYSAAAIIIPVAPKETGSSGIAASLMQQVGGLPGITVPETASSSEIVTLLRSNVLREKIITKNDLLPKLFPEEWNKEAKTWKVNAGFTLNPFTLSKKLIRFIKPAGNKNPVHDEGIPSIWDGLRKLDDTVAIMSNVKEKTIQISAESDDPVLSAQIVGYYLSALNDHMSGEAKRVATINRSYLEEQLSQTMDPFIKQKIYNMIAQQLETSMMAEVKENFAFKIIDPPRVPDRKVKPKRLQMVMIGLLSSLFIGLLIVFIRENLDRIKAQKNK